MSLSKSLQEDSVLEWSRVLELELSILSSTKRRPDLIFWINEELVLLNFLLGVLFGREIISPL